MNSLTNVRLWISKLQKTPKIREIPDSRAVDPADNFATHSLSDRDRRSETVGNGTTTYFTGF